MNGNMEGISESKIHELTVPLILGNYSVPRPEHCGIVSVQNLLYKRRKYILQEPQFHVISAIT